MHSVEMKNWLIDLCFISATLESQFTGFEYDTTLSADTHIALVFSDKQDRQCTHTLTWRRVRANIAAVKKQ